DRTRRNPVRAGWPAFIQKTSNTLKTPARKDSSLANILKSNIGYGEPTANTPGLSMMRCPFLTPKENSQASSPRAKTSQNKNKPKSPLARGKQKFAYWQIAYPH